MFQKHLLMESIGVKKRLEDETATTLEETVNFAVKSRTKCLTFVLHSSSPRVVPRPAISASESLCKIQIQ